eukprot:scaffold5892_cov169-Pinguiococcus_pyrenoidosus.AAC.4
MSRCFQLNCAPGHLFSFRMIILGLSLLWDGNKKSSFTLSFGSVECSASCPSLAQEAADSDESDLKILFVALDILMMIFSITAVSVAGSSDALHGGHICRSSRSYLGYGAGISAFLIFWILAQIGMVCFPCGPLREVATAPRSSNVAQKEEKDHLLTPDEVAEPKGV